MNVMSKETEQVMRQVFKRMNRLMLWHWRLGMGPYLNFWPSGIGQFIVLVHRGRKSGRIYRTPVNYAEIDGDVYVTAGFGKVADWYRNLMADPHTEVWLPDGRWEADVEDVTERDHHAEAMRAVLKGSGFAAYMAGVNPHTMSDDDLAAITGAYRLLRIRRVAPIAGLNGPGDMIWVWPLLTVVAFVAGLLWPRSSSQQKEAA